MAFVKQFKPEDVERLYRLASKENFLWADILPNIVDEMLDTLQKSACCPKVFAIASALTVTSALCGPKSSMFCHKKTTPSSLNLYTLAVSAPGGGKSSTFDHVISPALRAFNDVTGLVLNVETYTHAGLQSHQSETGGYGILTSDEGARVLAQIQGKQLKNEGERQFLCKTWSGRGDMTILRDQQRGYDETALCVLLFVQPKPLTAEMRHMDGEDGLIDRINFFVALPKWFLAEIIDRNGRIFNEKYSDVFYKTYMSIFKAHQNKTTVYEFEEEAQTYFDTLTDEYVRLFNDQYYSDSDNTDMQCTPEVANLVTSKDTLQLGRLSVAMYIWVTEMTRSITPGSPTLCNRVPKWAVESAQHLYSTSNKQRAIFLQSVSKPSEKYQSSMPQVNSIKDRVMKAVFKMKGPMVFPRDVGKHVKLIPAATLKNELQALSNGGKGKLLLRGRDDVHKDVFFKPHPDTLSEADHMWQVIDVFPHFYTAQFKNTDHFSDADMRLLRHHPSYEDLSCTIPDESDAELDLLHAFPDSQPIVPDILIPNLSVIEAPTSPIPGPANEADTHSEGPEVIITSSDTNDENHIPSGQGNARANRKKKFRGLSSTPKVPLQIRRKKIKMIPTKIQKTRIPVLSNQNMPDSWKKCISHNKGTIAARKLHDVYEVQDVPITHVDILQQDASFTTPSSIDPNSTDASENAIETSTNSDPMEGPSHINITDEEKANQNSIRTTHPLEKKTVLPIEIVRKVYPTRSTTKM